MCVNTKCWRTVQSCNGNANSASSSASMAAEDFLKLWHDANKTIKLARTGKTSKTCYVLLVDDTVTQ